MILFFSASPMTFFSGWLGRLLAGSSLLLITACTTHSLSDEATRPTIIIIYADELGCGEVSANRQGEMQTPSIDRLAATGIRFTNRYATSATCTPSPLALLTDTYRWRNEDAKILPGDAPLLIDTTSVTLAGMLRQKGYETAVVGQWRLKLGTTSKKEN